MTDSNDELVAGVDADIMALAALTLVQETIKHLLATDQMSQQQLRNLIEAASAIHLDPPVEATERRRRVSQMIRDIGRDLAR